MLILFMIIVVVVSDLYSFAEIFLFASFVKKMDFIILSASYLFIYLFLTWENLTNKKEQELLWYIFRRTLCVHLTFGVQLLVLKCGFYL